MAHQTASTSTLRLVRTWPGNAELSKVPVKTHPQVSIATPRAVSTLIYNVESSKTTRQTVSTAAPRGPSWLNSAESSTDLLAVFISMEIEAEDKEGEKVATRNRLIQKERDVDGVFLDGVHQWCGTPCAVWASRTLLADLGLPMKRPPPNSVHFQAFVLAPSHPAVLFTVLKDCTETLKDQKDTEREAQSTEADVFALETGKLLTSFIFKHCCCDFLIVPVTISRTNFTASVLKEQVDMKVEKNRRYYHGPRALSSSVFRNLEHAVMNMTGESS